MRHSWHWYGFSPVWVRMWVPNADDWRNDLSQYWHLNGFSFVWTLVCSTRFPKFENTLLQKLHLNCLLWTPACRFKFPEVVKIFSHSLHWNFESGFLVGVIFLQVGPETKRISRFLIFWEFLILGCWASKSLNKDLIQNIS